VLLSPWVAHNAKHGFRDFRLIATNGRGHKGGATGTGTIEAIRVTFHQVSAGGWSFLTGAHHPHSAAWTFGLIAGYVGAALLVVGMVTSLVRVVRGGRHPGIDTQRRALLLVWLVGLWLSYITSSRSGVGPHYLIVSYPVPFLLAALGLDDATSLVRRRSTVISLAVAAAVAACFVAFTLSFQAFVREHGGTGAGYGIAYHYRAELAAAVRARGLHVADASTEYLAWGHLQVPPGTTRIVAFRDRLIYASPLPCSGQKRSFGPIEACFPN
jgi:hypothetical protein